MRRCLFVFLLVLLPLQFTWAAAVSYCAHESAPKTRHLGHHEHHHKDASAGQAGDSKLPDGSHADCGHCHAHGAMAHAHVEAPAPVSLHQRAWPWPPSAHRLLAPSPPERPRWAALA